LLFLTVQEIDSNVNLSVLAPWGAVNRAAFSSNGRLIATVVSGEVTNLNAEPHP
jgi:hypothetical protein